MSRTKHFSVGKIERAMRREAKQIRDHLLEQDEELDNASFWSYADTVDEQPLEASVR